MKTSVLSVMLPYLPPISLGHSDDGFTDDWAVIHIYPSVIANLNFIHQQNDPPV